MTDTTGFHFVIKLGVAFVFLFVSVCLSMLAFNATRSTGLSEGYGVIPFIVVMGI